MAPRPSHATGLLARPFICRTCTRRLHHHLLLLSARHHRRTFAQQASPRRRSTTTSPDIYDVVCVGGGPAGLALLTALRAHPSTSRLRCLLIEAGPLAGFPAQAQTAASSSSSSWFSAKRDSASTVAAEPWTPEANVYSNRCSSLTPATIAFLERIGAWRHVRRDRAQAYEAMQVWDGIGGGRIEFVWPAGPSPSSGYPGSADQPGRTIAVMLENANLTHALLRRLHELGGVEVQAGMRVQEIRYGEETAELDLRQWPVVQLADGKEVAARLLVGADGAMSPVRTFADIDSRGWDYDRHAVVATLKFSEDSAMDRHLLSDVDGKSTSSKAQTAYQRFLPSGPIAMLPLPDGHATLVWSTYPAHAAKLKALSEDDFIASVNAAFRLSYTDVQYMSGLSTGQADELSWRLPHSSYPAAKVPREVDTVQAGSIASFPLRFRHADAYISPRIALVGDAAHTIHPLAGQGLNQGQADVEALAARLAWAAERGADLGDVHVLQGYEAQRYAHNHVLGGVVDKLHKVFALQNPLLAGLRDWGFASVGRFAPVRQWLMRRAAA